MTTGFDTQPTTFGSVVKTAPKPQAVGTKLPAQGVLTPPTTVEPRTFKRGK